MLIVFCWTAQMASTSTCSSRRRLRRAIGPLETGGDLAAHAPRRIRARSCGAHRGQPGCHRHVGVRRGHHPRAVLDARHHGSGAVQRRSIRPHRTRLGEHDLARRLAGISGMALSALRFSKKLPDSTIPLVLSSDIPKIN